MVFPTSCRAVTRTLTGGLVRLAMKRGQGGQVLVFGMEAGNGAIFFDSQVKLATLGVRQADHGRNQITVGEPSAVTLELDGHRLAVRDCTVHLRSVRCSV